MQIKELRTKLKMTQMEFADYFHIPVANIRHWEQGRYSPPMYVQKLIMKIAKLEGLIDED